MKLTHYSVEQFPKNKDITGLSDEQKEIRIKQKKKPKEKTRTCNRCWKTQPIKEFYIRNKATGARRLSCRDCLIKQQGCIEVGKLRFAKKIANKGFRRCSDCKQILPLTKFNRQKNVYKGRQHVCYDCMHKRVKEYVNKQKKEIGDFYIRQYGLLKGITKFTKKIKAQLKEEIIKRRSAKYFIDGQEFVTLADFARYIENKYGLPVTTTEKRIQDGKTEEECKLSEHEMRKKYSGTIKGKVVVTDTVTGEVFEFNNTKDENLFKMFSLSTITRCIKTGEKTKTAKNSKYSNPCFIKRI